MIDFASEIAAVWGASLWRASWQGAIVLAVTWAVARWCTFLSPRVVCWVWRLACLKLLVALVSVSPIAIAVLPPTAPIAQPPVKVAHAQPMLPDELIPLDNDELSESKSQLPASAESQTPATIARAPINFSTFLLPVWLAGVLYCVYRSAGQWQAARRLVQTSQECASDSLLRLYQAEACRIGVRRLPRLRLSPEADGPILIGVWRPAIILPAECERTFAESELCLMLAHELAHHKRKDLAWNWLPTTATWLFYFHPLVWLMTRCWSEAQEAACDETLLQRNVAPPAEYGRLLLKLAALSPNRSPASLATAGVLGAYRNLERRILTMTRVRPFSARRMAIAATAMLLTGVIAIVPWRLVAQETALAKTKPEALGSETTGAFAVDLKGDKDTKAPEVSGKVVPTSPKDDAGASSNSENTTAIISFAQDGQTAAGERKITITGRATDAEGKPVQGATIYLASLRFVGAAKAKNIKKSTTNTAGEYEFRDFVLPLQGNDRVGGYQVYGVAPGLGLAWQGPRYFHDIERPKPGERNPSTHQAEQVYSNDKLQADLRFGPATTLVGRFVDEQDKPIADAKVKMFQCRALTSKKIPREDQYLIRLAEEIIVSTDANGRFAIPGLPEKSVAQLQISLPDSSRITVQSTTGDSADIAPAKDGKGIKVGEVDFKFSRAHVQVFYGDTDTPAKGASLGASLDGAEGVFVSGKTNDEGLAVLTLPTGKYDLGIAPAKGDAPIEFVRASLRLIVGDALLDQPTIARIPAGCKLEIEVVDADSGQPVPKVGIYHHLAPDNPNLTNAYALLGELPQTDEDGKLRIGVEPGKLSVMPQPGPGYQLVNSSNEPVQCEAGKTVSLKFKLRKQPKADARPEGKAEEKAKETSEAKTDKNDSAAAKALAQLKELGAQPVTSKQIGIQSGWRGTDADLKLINDLSELNWLYVDFETPGVDGAALAKLQLVRPVDHLILDAASNEILEKLPQLPPCKTLLLPRYSLTEPGFDRLAKLSQEIESLQLMQGISDAGLQPIGQIRSLKKLQIVEGGITDAGLAQLVGLDRLEELTLIDCWKIRGTGFAKLADIRSLRSLTALTIPIDADALKALATLTQLTSLKIQPLNKPAVEDLDRLRAELKDVKISILPYDGPQAGYFVAEGDDGKAARERSQTALARGAMAEAFTNSAETWISRKEYVRAKAFFEEALRLSSGTGKVASRVSCNAAWFLATCPDDTCRDGRRAVELATKACEGFDWKNREAVDTLAAASAEVGDFDAAVKWQAEAIKLATGDKKFQQGAEERLSLYRQKKPYRDAPAAK